MTDRRLTQVWLTAWMIGVAWCALMLVLVLAGCAPLRRNFQPDQWVYNAGFIEHFRCDPWQYSPGDDHMLFVRNAVDAPLYLVLVAEDRAERWYKVPPVASLCLKAPFLDQQVVARMSWKDGTQPLSAPLSFDAPGETWLVAGPAVTVRAFRVRPPKRRVAASRAAY